MKRAEGAHNFSCLRDDAFFPCVSAGGPVSQIFLLHTSHFLSLISLLFFQRRVWMDGYFESAPLRSLFGLDISIEMPMRNSHRFYAVVRKVAGSLKGCRSVEA